MFILYTVAPLLYRLASSAYFNLSLLSSDFFGLLFGAHMTANSLLKNLSDLRLRPFPLRMFYLSFSSTLLKNATRTVTALQAVLALLPFLFSGHLGPHSLLLALYSYVLSDGFLTSPDTCL
jgi:Solute carrier family 35